jgi:hypothetical protein
MAASSPNPVIFRMEWCRRQKTKAHPGPEQDGWDAEVTGLRDALLNRDHMREYQQAPPEVLERYVLGFQDGQTLIRAAWIDLN